MSDTAAVETEDEPVTEAPAEVETEDVPVETSFLDEIGTDEDDIDLDIVDDVDPAVSEPEPVEGTPEETPATEEPAVEEPAPTTPEEPVAVVPVEEPPAQAVAPVEVPAQPDAVPPAQPVPTAEEINTQWSDWRTQAEDMLATQHFNLSEDLVEELQTSPETAIPKLSAKIYLDATTAAIGQITTNLPGLVAAVQQRQTEVAQQEEAFFTRWPQLKEHGETVVRLANAYRGANPNVTAENMIRDVGAQAMVALQIPLETPPATPDTPAAQPFTPAATAPSPAAAPAPSKSAFEILSDEFEEDLDLD